LILWRVVWPTLTNKLVFQGLKIKVFHPLVLFWFPMRMRYPRHFNIGPADSHEGSCEVVKVGSSLSTMVKILAKDNKSWYYKAELPELVYTPRMYPHVLSCICVFLVTAMRCIFKV